MDIKSFESLIRSENSARRFFVKLCWKKYRRFCSRCHSYEIYRIVGKRFRCKQCKYTFHDFSGRWIGRLRISCRQWLWIIKLFEIELSARRIAEQLGLSYPTVLKAVNTIRTAILAHASDGSELLCGEIEMDESYFGEAVERAHEAVEPPIKCPYSAFSNEMES